MFTSVHRPPSNRRACRDRILPRRSKYVTSRKRSTDRSENVHKDIHMLAQVQQHSFVHSPSPCNRTETRKPTM